MNKEETRTDAAMHELRKLIIDLVPNINSVALELVDARMLLIASSAIVDHLSEEIKNK